MISKSCAITIYGNFVCNSVNTACSIIICYGIDHTNYQLFRTTLVSDHGHIFNMWPWLPVTNEIGCL